MPRFVFKFIRISVNGENIENGNILSVFGAKTPFSNLSGLMFLRILTAHVIHVSTPRHASSACAEKTFQTNIG